VEGLPHGVSLYRASPMDLPCGDGEWASLSRDERLRAERLPDPVVRARFVAVRALLRRVLAEHLGRRADGIPLAVGPNGKPVLLGPDAALGFNVTHSAAHVLLALAWDHDVGVDAEDTDVRPADAEPIARRWFHADEVRAWLDLPEPDRRVAFRRIWARREAALKALGVGLDGDAARLEVRVDARPQDWLRHVRGHPDLTSWSSVDLHVPGASAALVVRRRS
jgi:4'-phosphopantetheinyl transferase